MADLPVNLDEGRPLLLYAGSCPKCRFLSRLVVILSLYNIRRVSLERPEWQKFYWEDYPQAQGYPVLFFKKRPVFGMRVFFVVPLIVIYSWWQFTSRLVGRKTVQVHVRD